MRIWSLLSLAFIAGPLAAQRPLKVVTSLPTHAAIAREIVGDRGTVIAIAQGTEEPHFVQPKPSFVPLIGGADVFVTTGLDLELWVPALLDKAGNRRQGHDTPGAHAPGLHSEWRSRLQPRRTGDGERKRPGQDPRPRSRRFEIAASNLAASIACVLALAAPAVGQIDVTSPGNKHNLSASGPGPVKSSTATEICVFCHTPHNANPAVPLWNQTLSTATYQPYASTTLKATVGLPTGSSKLCLACHDGTVAVGNTINNGRIAMQGVNAQGNESVRRILRIVFMAKETPQNGAFNADSHHALAHKIASEGMVLLKNNGILPLKDHQHIAVIGRAAENAHFPSGGSSHINPTKVAVPFKELQAQAGNAEFMYADGYPKDNSLRQDLIDQAVTIARSADVAVLYIALPTFKESEGYDRPDLDLTDQQVALIKAVAEVQPDTFFVLTTPCTRQTE